MATVILPERVTEPLVIEAQKFRRKLTQLLPRYEGNAPFYIARVEREPTVYDLTYDSEFQLNE